MKKLFSFIFIFLSFTLFKSNVFAESFSLNISCPSTAIAGQSITCSVSIGNSDFTIEKVSGTYSYPGLNGSTTSFLMTSTSSLNLTIPQDAQVGAIYTVSVNNVVANEEIEGPSVNALITILSNDNTLKELNLSNGTFNQEFNPNTTNYDAVINEDSTFIGAACNGPCLKLEGTGEKSLKYGSNSFNIVVTSAAGNSKTYTVNITRPDNRNTNNYLSSLFVSNTDINFDKNVTEYNLSTSSNEVTISASKEDTKATVTGDTGKKILDYGLNKFSVKVIAENTESRTYYINITRKDNRSENNYLKSITLSSGSIKFSKSTTVYNIDVSKDVEKIKISASLDDNNASFVSGYEPREVKLSPGNTTVYIKVKSEKGDIKTYTLNINRDDGRDSDATLKEIKLSAGKINFSSDKYSYKVNVEYSVDRIKIEALPSSDKTKVTISGKEELKVGNNVFKIITEAENGAKATYKITIKRKKSGENLSSNNYIKNLTIKDYEFIFNKNIFTYTITTNQDKLDLKVELEDKNATYKIKGNNNLKNASKVQIIVTAEDGEIKTYTLEIKKSSKIFMFALMGSITLITIGVIVIILLNMKKIRREKDVNDDKDFETIEEDFKQIK